MTTTAFNPFRPGSIVVPGMFAGRTNELDTLTNVLHQTKSGGAAHFFVCGERGIGKSSLLFYLQCLASKEITTSSGASFNFLSVSIELDQADTQEVLLTRLGGGLKKAIAGHARAKELGKRAWNFLSRFEVLGVKYTTPDRTVGQAHEQLQEVVDALVGFCEETADEIDGVIFLIDEADKPASSAHLGATLKLLTEQMTKRKCERVSLGLFGLPEVLDRLRQSHESSLRLFEILTPKPLLPSERKWVLKRGLEVSREKSKAPVDLDVAARDLIAELSEGYPHFIQQFAYCAFDADEDFRITIEDVVEGALRENGAFHQLGVKYFQDWYFEQIRSDDYRLVLQTMSRHGDAWVAKEQIRRECKISEGQLTNALSALKKRHIIIPRDGARGEYRLPSKAFAAWIDAFTGTLSGDAVRKLAQAASQPPSPGTGSNA
jgi:hypothetical protein